MKTEKEMREEKVPWPKTLKELREYINGLVEREHDYGTCVYAMSMSAEAAFNYVAHKLGVTGFQASCAELDFLRRTRGLEWGKLIDYNNLLYPQYCTTEHFPSIDNLMRDNREELSKRAKKLLDENKDACEDVKDHWKKLASYG